MDKWPFLISKTVSKAKNNFAFARNYKKIINKLALIKIATRKHFFIFIR